MGFAGSPKNKRKAVSLMKKAKSITFVVLVAICALMLVSYFKKEWVTVAVIAQGDKRYELQVVAKEE